MDKNPYARKNVKLDWQRIKSDYICGILDREGKHIYPSYSCLAEMYSCNSDSLRQRGAKEKWSQERSDHKEKIGEDYKLATVDLNLAIDDIKDRAIGEIDSVIAQIGFKAVVFILQKMESCSDSDEKERVVTKYSKILLDYQKAIFNAFRINPESDIKKANSQLGKNAKNFVDTLGIDELRRIVFQADANNEMVDVDSVEPEDAKDE